MQIQVLSATTYQVYPSSLRAVTRSSEKPCICVVCRRPSLQLFKSQWGRAPFVVLLTTSSKFFIRISHYAYWIRKYTRKEVSFNRIHLNPEGGIPRLDSGKLSSNNVKHFAISVSQSMLRRHHQNFHQRQHIVNPFLCSSIHLNNGVKPPHLRLNETRNFFGTLPSSILQPLW